MKKEDKPKALIKEDYELLIKILDTVSSRGAIKGSELSITGYLYDKIKALCQ
jgi:hypothetical protein